MRSPTIRELYGGAITFVMTVCVIFFFTSLISGLWYVSLYFLGLFCIVYWVKYSSPEVAKSEGVCPECGAKLFRWDVRTAKCPSCTYSIGRGW